jgi:hypothetical protein
VLAVAPDLTALLAQLAPIGRVRLALLRAEMLWEALAQRVKRVPHVVRQLLDCGREHAALRASCSPPPREQRRRAEDRTGVYIPVEGDGAGCW